MCKHSRNLIALVLAFVMAFTMAVPAFAAGSTGSTNTTNSASVADITPQRIQSWKEHLYNNTTETLYKLPTDLAPTPLPEDTDLDPLDYWKQIYPLPSLANNIRAGETTRPVEELYQEIRQLVNDLTAGLTSTSDKFAALSLWVDRNITYSTANRTYNVYLIYERRYGACMERSYLLYFMATLAGIKAVLLFGETTVATDDMPVGTGHNSTGALDENGVWFGDAHSTARGKPIATVAHYDDGMTKYNFDLETGEVSSSGTIKGIKKKPVETTSVNFVDVPEDAWYAEAVQWAVSWGLTNGTSETTFSPEKLCTNDEIITFLYRTAADPGFDLDRRQPFTPKNDWAADALKWAYYENIIGYDYKEASEDTPCTRKDAVRYIWRAFGKPYVGAKTNFTDLDSDEHYFYMDSINWAVSEGIVGGTSPTTFSPDLVCNRATIVTLLYRAYKDDMPLN